MRGSQFLKIYESFLIYHEVVALNGLTGFQCCFLYCAYLFTFDYNLGIGCVISALD